MHTASYVLVACPLLLTIYASLCWSLDYLPVGLYDDLAHYVRIAFVTEVVLSCFQFFAWARSTFAFTPRQKISFPELAPTDAATKFGVPLMEEIARFCTLAMIVLLGKSEFNCNVTYVYTVAAVYGLNHLVASIVRFSPFDYHSRFQRFLRSYEIYDSHMLRRLTKKASSTLSYALDSAVTLASVNSPAKPVFNLNSFDEPPQLSHSKLIRSIRLDTLEASPDFWERMYSVSPKNTLHLQIGKSGGEDEVSSRLLAKLQALEDPLGPSQVDLDPRANDSLSVHTSDTHFGGGGGGNFRLKLPDGTELEFGSGAGFDYRHRSRCESEDSSHKNREHESSQSLPSPEFVPSNPSNSSFCDNPYSPSISPSTHGAEKNTLKNIIYWFRWLLPLAQKEDESTNISPLAVRRSIRKKLSTYTLNSDTSSLKSFPCKSYGAIDLESQLPVRTSSVANIHSYYKFAKFANQFFDVRPPRLLEFFKGVDPAFYHFGTLLPKFPAFFFIVYSTCICLWQFTSTLIIAYPFVAYHPDVLTFVVILSTLAVIKLFCINYLHDQATCSYRVSLVVELVLNLVAFAFVYSCYFSLEPVKSSV